MIAPGTIHVSVTDDDIRQGQIADTGFCPIALAIKRQITGGGDRLMPPRTHVEVLSDTAYITSRTRFTVAVLPDVAHRFVYDFDHQGPAAVGPVEFDLTFRDTAW